MIRKWLLFLLTIQIAFVYGANAKKIVKNFIKSYEDAPYIHISYQEKIELSLTGNVIVKKGYTIFSRENNVFRIENDDQIVAMDGTNFYRLNKIQNQLTIDYVKKNDDFFLFRSLFQEPEKYFYLDIISETKIEKKKVYVLKLTPKEDTNQLFSSIKIWLIDKSNQIVKMEVQDLNDNITTYEILDIQKNKSVEKKLFQIETLPEYEVIDLRL
ncbi:MAG: hypothetical protein Kow00108_09130 [Calditrichia bacterium]